MSYEHVRTEAKSLAALAALRKFDQFVSLLLIVYYKFLYVSCMADGI